MSVLDDLLRSIHCDLCGQDVTGCVCPRCSICGFKGLSHCYAEHGLKLTAKQRASRSRATAGDDGRRP
jgi:hypothetical protein